MTKPSNLTILKNSENSYNSKQRFYHNKPEIPRTPKLHEDVRSFNSHKTSQKIKSLLLWATIFNTILNVGISFQGYVISKETQTTISTTQISKRNNLNNLKIWQKNIISASPLIIYIWTILLLLCISRYFYQTIMFRITGIVKYNSRKFVLLITVNTLVLCIQILFIGLAYFPYAMGVVNLISDSVVDVGRKGGEGPEEDIHVPDLVPIDQVESLEITEAPKFPKLTKQYPNLILLSTLITLLTTLSLWIKLAINDKKINRYHKDLEYSRRKILSSSNASNGTLTTAIGYDKKDHGESHRQNIENDDKSEVTIQIVALHDSDIDLYKTNNKRRGS